MSAIYHTTKYMHNDHFQYFVYYEFLLPIKSSLVHYMSEQICQTVVVVVAEKRLLLVIYSNNIRGSLREYTYC